jgi:integrase
VRNSSFKSIDLARAVASASTHQSTDITLAELVGAYCAVKLDGNDLRLRKWIQAFGHQSAWSITSQTLELAAHALIEHGYAPATANRDLSALGSVYKWAKARRLTPPGFKSPTLGVTRFEEPIRRVHVERAEIERLLDAAFACSDRRFAVFVRLLLETGARKSELLNRVWSDLDLDRREILAPCTKNGTPRVLFFSDETANLIARVWSVQRKFDSGLIFEGRVPGQPVNYRRAWSWLCAHVGLEELRLHDMRHVAAANLLRAGTTLGVAAQVLGHDPAVLSRRYGHLETEALKRAQEAAWRRTPKPMNL